MLAKLTGGRSRVLSGEYGSTIALYSSGAPKRPGPVLNLHEDYLAGVAIPLPILINANSGEP